LSLRFSANVAVSVLLADDAVITIGGMHVAVFTSHSVLVIGMNPGTAANFASHSMKATFRCVTSAQVAVFLAMAPHFENCKAAPVASALISTPAPGEEHDATGSGSFTAEDFQHM
jgi:hypothetical protein